MDRISIILQDKVTIEKLANDPDVQIKIKDAIIDAIGKRSLKLMNVNLEISNAVYTVSELLKREILDQFCDSSGWRTVLKPEYKQIIENQATAKFNELYSEVILSQLKMLREKVQRIVDSGAELWEKQVQEKIANFDFDKAIKEAIQAEVALRLDRR